VLYTETVNAGSQDDRGIELAASYGLLRNVSIVENLRVFGAFTYSAFTYDGFKSNANNNAGTIDFSGNDVVGVPKHAWNAGFDLLTSFGVYANASFQNVGAMPLTFDGAHRAKGYNLLDAKLGYHRPLPAGFALDGSIGARNLTGATYYTMAFLNQSYAGAAPNVYLNGSYTASFYGNLYVSKGF
jgi:iron complex outermembrane receptor protein